MITSSTPRKTEHTSHAGDYSKLCVYCNCNMSEEKCSYGAGSATFMRKYTKSWVFSFYYYRLCFRPHMQLDATNGCWKRRKKKSWQLAMELHLRLNHTHNTTNVSFLIQLVFCRLPTFGITGHPASATSLSSFAWSQRTVAGACSRWVPQPLTSLPALADWLGHSEGPATTSAPSTGRPFLLSCGWTSTQLIFSFTLVTNSVGNI